jgi:hypothetical protein
MMPLFDYFMVRITRTEESAQLAGLVERLGTGEKRSFSTGEQLLGLVAGWAGPDSNLPAPSGGCNPAGHGPPAAEGRD